MNHNPIQADESNKSFLGRCFINCGDYILGDLFDPTLKVGSHEFSLTSTRQVYLRKVMEVVLININNSDLIFYISFDVHSSIHKLPSYGSNVISIVLGDEMYRIPFYINKLKAVFKAQGSNPAYVLNGLSKSYKFSYINFIVWLQFFKALRYYIPSLMNYLLIELKSWQSDKWSKSAPIYDIPLGYGSQLDLPMKDIDERSLDLFFGGSIVHKKYSSWSPKRWLPNQKRLSRERMIESILQIQEKHPEWIFETLTRDTYTDTEKLSVNDGYSEKMMNAKICLVPRGATLDTCRLFEALRYGCVIIADGLPSTWFYDGMPIIKVDDWKELEAILAKLLSNEKLLNQKHQELLRWWNEKCSEVVVGKFIADKINCLDKTM